MIEQQNRQQAHGALVIAGNPPGHDQRQHEIQDAQYALEQQEVGKVLGQQLGMLADVAVVEILNAEVVQDLEQVGNVEQRKIQAIVAVGHAVLYRQINAEDKKRLDQQVDKNQEQDVEQKFAVQNKG